MVFLGNKEKNFVPHSHFISFSIVLQILVGNLVEGELILLKERLWGRIEEGLKKEKAVAFNSLILYL